MSFAGVIETPLEYFLGTDAEWDFTIYTTDQKTACRDVTGYTTNFMVKRRKSDSDTQALISKAGTVSGTFNASPSLNTQIIAATVLDTDTDRLDITATGKCYWELKRTDAGLERVLAFGDMTLRQSVHRT